jgi:hypothetical protein
VHDVTDLARIEEAMAPLEAHLDELRRQYNRVVDAVADQTLASMDLAEARDRTGDALRKLPAILAALEEVLAVHDEMSDWAYATFPDADEHWGRMRAAAGVEDLNDALDVISARLSSVIEREAKEGDADRARVALAEIVGRVR